MQAKLFFADRNHWMTAVFTAYLVLSIVFALIYRIIYAYTPNAFLFASEIARSQSAATRESATAAAAPLLAQRAVIEEARTELAKGTILRDASRRGADIHLPSRSRIHLSRKAVPRAFAAFNSIEIYDQRGVLLYEFTGGYRDLWPETPDGYREVFREELERVNQQLAALQPAISAEPGVIWSFWDFVYFSGITQATVGYGDILPNSTTVRLVVLIQVLLGYALLVVVINLALTPTANTQTRGHSQT